MYQFWNYSRVAMLFTGLQLITTSTRILYFFLIKTATRHLDDNFDKTIP